MRLSSGERPQRVPWDTTPSCFTERRKTCSTFDGKTIARFKKTWIDAGLSQENKNEPSISDTERNRQSGRDVERFRGKYDRTPGHHAVAGYRRERHREDYTRGISREGRRFAEDSQSIVRPEAH